MSARILTGISVLGSLLLLLARAQGAEVQFVIKSGGEIYELRWGREEGGGDRVQPYPRWGNPVCFKVGSWVGVRIIWDPGETPCDWAVTRSSLISRLTLVTYWLEGACNAPGGHGMHKPDDIHWFPVSVPDFVDWAELAGDVVTCDEMGRAGSGRSTSMWSEVFLVLDRPKPPMDPAWVTFLRYTCKWARYRPGPDNQMLMESSSTRRHGFGIQPPPKSWILKELRTAILPLTIPRGSTSGPSKGIGTLRVDLDSLPVLGRGPTLLTNCIHWRMENAVFSTLRRPW